MLIISIMRIAAKSEAGMTLVELMVAAVLIATFFTAIFEVNAVCLRYVAAGKESLAAISAANDRAENLRNLAFGDLTSTTDVAELLTCTGKRLAVGEQRVRGGKDLRRSQRQTASRSSPAQRAAR
jgi:type II secretory pathway pseudopilin PulG